MASKNEIARIVLEAVGGGSVCWEDMSGTGTFDEAKANEIADRAITKIRNLDNETFLGKARKTVYDYIKPRLEKTDTHVTFSLDEVYVVWFSKVLHHWKALVSTTLPDGMYYEVTHNGIAGETYLDAYKKFDNICIPDSENAPAGE